MTHILIKYSTKEISKTEKVRFYYALKGRNGKSGIIKLYNITFLSKGVLLSEEKHRKDIILFFENWKVPIELYMIELKSIEKKR